MLISSQCSVILKQLRAYFSKADPVTSNEVSHKRSIYLREVSSVQTFSTRSCVVINTRGVFMKMFRRDTFVNSNIPKSRYRILREQEILGGYSFSTYTKSFDKCVSVGKNVSFSENFASALHSFFYKNNFVRKRGSCFTKS